jgi:predicted amidohydrolase YtcJ
MSSLLLVNGRLHTQDPACPQATAVAIRAGRILAVGEDGEIRALAGAGAKVIDLRGRLVIPGLVDGHIHFYDWALGRQRLQLSGAASLGHLVDRVAQAAQAAPPGGWILGQGWNETDWADPRMPLREDLDRAAPGKAVLLWRADLHLAAASSPALEAAGIGPGTPDPPMGIIDRDPGGRPTGILRDLAVNLATGRVPAPTDAQVARAFQDGSRHLHALGLTGIQDQRLMGGIEGAPALRAWQALAAERRLELRVWTNLPGERLDDAIALGLRTGLGDDVLRLGHCKVFADGAQGVRTAWQLEPYEGGGGTGLPLTPVAAIEDALRRARDHGLALSVHANGDRANRELSQAFERVLGAPPAPGAALPRAPHRIEHLQLIRPEDLQRLARLGVMASVQPVEVGEDIDMMAATVGARGRYGHAWRSILDAGIPFAFGSDSPVSDPNPFWGIHAAVTRQRRDGTPAGGWHPEQRLTVAEAVWAYTMGPALAAGLERDLGSISPGKLADLVVVDRDLFAVDPMELHEAKPVMTLFDGRVVHAGD